MSWKKLLESVSESLNDHIQLRNDYLMAENRILRNQIDGRVQLTDNDRKELAEIGTKLGKSALAEIATVATPDTILAWHRKFANQKVETSKSPKSVGRPRVDQEIEDLVIRMVRENCSWGYDRIQGGLNHLGYTISDQTVGNILKCHGISPAPERKKTVTWREFTGSHLDVLLATDFFNSDVWNWVGLIVSYLLRVVHFGRYEVYSVGMTLQRYLQANRAFIMQLLAITAQIWSGLQSPQHDGGADRGCVFEGMLSDSQNPLCQNSGIVISLHRIKPGQIRDGPERPQLWLDQKWNDTYREAA